MSKYYSTHINKRSVGKYDKKMCCQEFIDILIEFDEGFPLNFENMLCCCHWLHGASQAKMR